MQIMNVAQVNKNKYKVEIPNTCINHGITGKSKNEVNGDCTSLLLSRSLSIYDQFAIMAFTK